MSIPASACLITCCLCVGSLTGAAEKMGDDMHYNYFIENSENYYLVDDLGRPVSQEAK